MLQGQYLAAGGGVPVPSASHSCSDHVVYQTSSAPSGPMLELQGERRSSSPRTPTAEVCGPRAAWSLLPQTGRDHTRWKTPHRKVESGDGEKVATALFVFLDPTLP